jgi:hypothetical protein
MAAIHKLMLLVSLPILRGGIEMDVTLMLVIVALQVNSLAILVTCTSRALSDPMSSHNSPTVISTTPVVGDGPEAIAFSISEQKADKYFPTLYHKY